MPGESATSIVFPVSSTPIRETGGHDAEHAIRGRAPGAPMSVGDTNSRGRLRQPTQTARTAEYSHTHYLTVGLALAGLWLLSRDRSLLFHAVQMLAVMSVLTGLQIVLRRRAGEVVPYTRLVVAKLVLIALAVGFEWLLAPETSRSNAIVAAFLVVLVTALGPKLDRVAAHRARARRGADQTLPSPSPGSREPGTRASFDPRKD